jgi:hypothetical protein
VLCDYRSIVGLPLDCVQPCAAALQNAPAADP